MVVVRCREVWEKFLGVGMPKGDTIEVLSCREPVEIQYCTNAREESTTEVFARSRSTWSRFFNGGFIRRGTTLR